MANKLTEIVNGQKVELNKKAKIFGTQTSPIKRPYVSDRKFNFTGPDLWLAVKRIKGVYKLPSTMKETTQVIINDTFRGKTQISKEDFGLVKEYLSQAGVDEFGVFEVTPERLFKGYGSPHKYAIVLSSAMDKKEFIKAPHMGAQLECAKVYYDTGAAAIGLAKLLQSHGFGASPNHSMGGQLDYSMAAEWAGIGVTGKHSMAITKKNGPCHRLSLVYTNIENLTDHIQEDADEMAWIKDFCKKCGKCVRDCQTGAIYSEPVVLDGHNPTRVNYEKCSQGFIKYGCGVCIKSCPFTTAGYDKIKASFLRNQSS